MMTEFRRSRQRIVSGGMGLALVPLVLFAVAPSGFDQPTAAKVADSTKRSTRNWTNFRGPGGNGHAVDANPPLHWSIKEDKNVLWKTEVPKPGMSSPVIWGNRLFLTGADVLSRQIYCFDTETGELLWKHDVDGIPGSPSRDNLPKVLDQTGLAAPTATTNGRSVAAVFATGDLVCLDLEGKRIWAAQLGIPENPYGHASSLMSHENLLFVQYDQKENSKLLAFHMASGKTAWQVKRTVISWSSPILMDNNGRMELILTNSKAVDSYDPKSGKRFWHVECLGGDVAPSAAYANGIVYVANEYATASAINAGNHGTEPEILWEWDEVLPNAASPLASRDYLFLPSGYGIINCLDGKTGKVIWEREFDKGFYSSPILVNDRVYIIDLSGTMQIFRNGKEFELLGTPSIGEAAFATPAFVGDRIYIRGLKHLFCIEEKK